MAIRSPEKPLSTQETTKLENNEDKKETKELSASEVGKQRMELAKSAISAGVDAVKGKVGGVLKFLGEKATALLAPDVLVKKGARVAGEFVAKDYAKTVEHATMTGEGIKTGAEAIGRFALEDYKKTVADATEIAKRTRDVAIADYEKTKGHIEAAAKGLQAGAEAAGKFAAADYQKTKGHAEKAGGAVAEGARFVSEKAQRAIESAVDKAAKGIEALQNKMKQLEQATKERIRKAAVDFDKAQLDARRKILNPIAKGVIGAEVKILETLAAKQKGDAAAAEAQAKFYSERGNVAAEQMNKQKAQEFQQKAEKTLKRMESRQNIRNILEQLATAYA